MEKTIRIEMVNISKMGTVGVKDEKGEWYNLSKKASPPLPQPVKGGSYDITYTENDWNGKPSRWISKMVYNPAIPKAEPEPEEVEAEVKVGLKSKSPVVLPEREMLMVRENAMNNAVALSVAYIEYMVASGEAKKLTEQEFIGFVNERRLAWYREFVSDITNPEDQEPKF